jgi:hypothetical protein
VDGESGHQLPQSRVVLQMRCSSEATMVTTLGIPQMLVDFPIQVPKPPVDIGALINNIGAALGVVGTVSSFGDPLVGGVLSAGGGIFSAIGLNLTPDGSDDPEVDLSNRL